MIPALDSAIPPTSAQVAAAKAAGIRMWCVYLATKPSVGLYRAWTDAEIEAVRPINPRPIAFCSGRDDPLAVRAAATRLRLRACVDVEDGIRPDGPWLQAWMDAAGSGLYSYASAFPNRRMAFALLADRSQTPPDPKATWAFWHPRPSVPCGWQWWGTHNEFGVGVDRLWLDDWFLNQSAEDNMDLRIINADGAKGNYGTNGAVKWWLSSPDIEGGPPNHPGGMRDLYPEIPPTIKVSRAYFDSLPEVTGPPGPLQPFDATITPKA